MKELFIVVPPFDMSVWSIPERLRSRIAILQIFRASKVSGSRRRSDDLLMSSYLPSDRRQCRLAYCSNSKSAQELSADPMEKSLYDVSNYLITLSARYSTDCGIVRPICWAVFKLMTNSNFVGC